MKVPPYAGIMYRMRQKLHILQWVSLAFLLGAISSYVHSRWNGPWLFYATDAPFLSPDGQGTAYVTPKNPVIAGTANSWAITCAAGPGGISAGGGVMLQISPWWGWSTPQNSDPNRPGYTTAQTEAEGVGVEFTAYPDLYYAVAKVVKGKLKGGQKITFIYGSPVKSESDAGKAVADPYAEENATFLIKTDGNGDGIFAPIKQSPKIAIIGGPAVKLIVTAPSLVVEGEPFRVAVAALDAAGNRSSFYKSKLIIRLIGTAAVAPDEIDILPDDLGANSFSATAADEGIALFEVEEAGGGATAVSNPVRVVEKAPQYRLYWADLHGHTQYSDGTGEPDDFYHYAYDVARLDVAAVTDHDHWGFSPLDENPEFWEVIKRSAREAYKAGEFVTFLGYEFTCWRQGHYYVIYNTDDGPLIGASNSGGNDLKTLWNTLGGMRAITIPNHVAGGPAATDWDYYNRIFEPVMDIVSRHGVSERMGAPGEIYNPSPGHFAVDALARGYRIGFVGGGDSHNGHPGVKDYRAETGGLAGIWAKELTRESIFDAIRARRTYATTGARIYLEFRVNGVFMGESLRIADPEADRIFEARIIGAAPIALVELIKNGRLLSARRPMTNEYDFSFVEYGPANQSDYYYLRVHQADGEAAWSSPVWIDLF